MPGEAETHQALSSLGGPEASEHERCAAALYEELRLIPSGGAHAPKIDNDVARLRRAGDMWQASYRGHVAYLRDTKGLHDLATLLAHPGTDLSALSLAGGELSHSAHRSRAEPVLDHAGLIAYRRRLHELDDELASAQDNADLARQQRASEEREQLLTELRRATRPGGGSRSLSTRLPNAPARRSPLASATPSAASATPIRSSACTSTAASIPARPAAMNRIEPGDDSCC